MKNSRENDLGNRRSAAAEAKAALLRGHRAAKEAAEPTRLARQEERRAAAAARDERRAERERAKLEEQERVDAKASRHRSAADAAVDARRKGENDMISRVIEDEAARKTERDRRYAKRKARKQ